MVEYITIGKIVNTHGIKGEVRLLSKFKYKNKVFKKDMTIYIGKSKEKEIINTYRKHKNFDMITMTGYNNINQILKYKGEIVYINKNDLLLGNNEYLDSELIDMDVFLNKKIVGKVISVTDNGGGNKTLGVLINNKKSFIPLIDEFVKVNLDKNNVEIFPIEGMI